MGLAKVKTLLLYAQYSNTLSYYDDWKDAFIKKEEFLVDPVNICSNDGLEQVAKLVKDTEFIILVHSAIGDTLDNINPFRSLLKSRKCPLLSFVANEVNLPSPSSMKDKIDFLKDIEADFIATQLPLEAGRWLYGECTKSKVVAVPHALNPEAFKSTILQKRRKIDIGVRTNRYQPYLGDNDRNDLIEFFQRAQFEFNLKMDINLKDRFDRFNWAQFLNQCKATISNEAGSFFLERDDKTVNAISEYVKTNFSRANPHLKVTNEKSIIYRMREFAPRSIREWFKKAFGYANASELHDHMQAEIIEKFFADYRRPDVYTKAISSRHFDAIGTKTTQILLEGRYNDILIPNRHYIELKRDYSNIKEVMERFQDVSYRQTITDNAFDYVIENHTHSHRADQILTLLN